MNFIMIIILYYKIEYQMWNSKHPTKNIKKEGRREGGAMGLPATRTVDSWPAEGLANFSHSKIDLKTHPNLTEFLIRKLSRGLVGRFLML